jgi:hypothetical protein
MCHWRNHISTLRYELLYIICIIVIRVLGGGRNLPEVMDPEGSQGIQRNNTLEVKNLGLIVLIIMPLTYISKFSTLQISVIVVTTILKML